MAGLLSGLAGLGLDNLENMNIFEETSKAEESAEVKVVTVEEKDFIYDKTMECPVCGQHFSTKIMKTGKNKLIGTDQDLRPRYEGIDAVKYDVMLCTKCGYAALSRFFSSITSGQGKMIRENISKKVHLSAYDGETYSYDEAIERYKLALANAVVKRAKASEKAYTCLKLAWLLRGKAETLPADTPNLAQVKAELAEQEKEYIANAYEGFMDAFSKEQFPMCGMDEITMTYLVADLGRQIGKYDEALRMVARVLMAKNVSDRIKQKTIDLKELIREEREKAGK